jgi:alkanesulfonate monooxygenase SsuD/methylene tetrahydromethanopterin reductase-like flavin-dependent oxidoreductase (luciferase family)
VLDDDRDRARAIGLEARGGSTAMYSQFDAPDKTAAYRHLTGTDGLEDVADKSYLFTDPDSAIASLKALEELGITYVILRMQWFALEQKRMLQTLETFRDRVLPQFS